MVQMDRWIYEEKLAQAELEGCQKRKTNSATAVTNNSGEVKKEDIMSYTIMD